MILTFFLWTTLFFLFRSEYDGITVVGKVTNSNRDDMANVYVVAAIRDKSGKLQNYLQPVIRRRNCISVPILNHSVRQIDYYNRVSVVSDKVAFADKIVCNRVCNT